MGNALCCGSSPQGEGVAAAETVSREPLHGIANSAAGKAGSSTAAATASVGGSSSGLPRPSLDWYSVADADSDDGRQQLGVDEEWHDALSEVDLAEALEGWELERHTSDATVERAIHVSALAAVQCSAVWVVVSILLSAFHPVQGIISSPAWCVCVCADAESQGAPAAPRGRGPGLRCSRLCRRRRCPRPR